MVQSLEQNSGFDCKGILARVAWNMLEVDSADMCPICHFGIDLSYDSYRNFHDLTQADQHKFNIFSMHICPHCHCGLSLIHI